ncbi:MAG: hypothetical protein ABI443_14400 [Chthoniobacterales bacterium]
MSIHWIPILPVWLIAAVTVGLIILLGYGSIVLKQKNVPPKWIGILGAVRIAIILLFVICLFQPVVSCKHTVTQGPAMLVLMDTSLSMKAPEAEGRDPRLQETIKWLESSGLAKQLARNPHIYWFRFDQNARPIQVSDLKNLKADGPTTHYADSLSTAWDYYRQVSSTGPDGGIAPARVLLVSDGNDLGNRDIVEVAQSIGVPVDTLAPTSSLTKSAASVSIVNIQGARKIHLESQARFLVTVGQEGLDNKPFTLNIKEDGKVIQTQTITFSADQHEKQVAIAFRPSEVGLKVYEFEITGVPPHAVISNNHEKFTLQVTSDKNEVLFLEDTWRWDFKFLRRVFEDDPSFTFTGFLSRSGGAYSQFEEPDSKFKLRGFPQSHQELEHFDTFVLGDINPKRWPKKMISAIYRLVVEEGKSLIVIAGPNISSWADIPDMASLLPVEVTTETGKPIDGPVEVQVSQDGFSSTFFSGGGQNTWRKLPPLDQIYAPVRKRPAASILLESSTQANAYGRLIVIAEQPVGRGRVLYIGTDTLWKWQTVISPDETGASPYALFWQQALRSIAANNTSTGDVNLWLTPEHSKYQTDDNVVLRAEVQTDHNMVKPKIQGKVTLPDGKQILLDFAPHPTETGFYQAQFEAPKEGQYKISAEVLTEGKRVAEQTIAVDVEKSSAETSNTRINEPNLARIASATGGNKIDRGNAKTWPTPENIGKVSVEQVSNFDLWNNFTLLILLCLLLGTDWFLRLIKGYT